MGPDVRLCHSRGQTGPHTSFTSCRPHTARQGGPLLICEARDEPREPLHAPQRPTSALLPFAPSQEDLQQPAPPQEDTAAKAEEEAAEEVSAGLPEYAGQACLPPGVPEPSGQPLDLLEPPQPECEIPSGRRGGEDSQLGVAAEGWAWSCVWSFSPRPRVEETRGMQVGHGGPEEQPSASDPTPSWHAECPALERDLGCPCSRAHTRPPAGLPS